MQDDFQILVDTLLGSWLPAWKRKPSVKQILHPKFYWFDPGVARQVAGTAHLAVHPEERGFLFESYLLHELRAFLHYRDLDLPVGYWARRDGAVGAEVDFVVEGPRGLLCVEAKSADRWEPKFVVGLIRFREEHPTLRTTLVGVYAGTRELAVDGVRVLPWGKFLRELWDGDLTAQVV